MSPMMNAALDEVLVNEVGSGRRGPTLRIWEWNEPAVIIGSFQSVINEVDEDQLVRNALNGEGIGDMRAHVAQTDHTDSTFFHDSKHPFRL